MLDGITCATYVATTSTEDVGVDNAIGVTLVAMCSAKYQFTYIDVGTPERYSDGRTFDQSSLEDAMNSDQLKIPVPTKLPNQQIAAALMICWMIVMTTSSNIANDRESIKLSQDGGYTNLLIAIDEKVSENLDIIEKLKVYVSNASEILNQATKNRLYIKNVTIVVPSGWKGQQTWLQPAENETFERARILIAQKNLAYGDTPYTLQPRGCGEEGDYIHLTPNFLTTSESIRHPYKPAKKLSKEFAKLRWGVYDEDISIADGEMPQLYWHNGYRQLVGCTEGASFAPVNATGCQWSDGEEASDCDFVATEFHGTASLLSYEYFDNVVEFCDSREDSDTPHNKLARNLQNKNCNERSVWDVMLAHPDFAFDCNTLNQCSVPPPQPLFRVVKKPYTGVTVPPTTSTQAISSSSSTTASTSTTSTTTTATTTTAAPVQTCSQDIVCLCLDVSGSMGTANRIGTMADSASVYILTYLRNGTAVGIVSFESSADLLADMKEISSSADRSFLISALPRSASGGTNIEAGLNECQRILRNYAGARLAESRILLIGDGDGNVGSAIPSIKADGITIDTVLYGQGAKLVEIAEETGGTENFVSDVFSQQELRQFFTGSASRGCSVEQTDTIVQNEEFVIPAGEGSLESTVDLDETIGLDTKIVVDYNSDVNLTVETEKNLTTTITKDQRLQLIVATLQGEAGGYIKYTITKTSQTGSDVAVLVTVTSAPLPGVEPIVVSYKVGENYVAFDEDTQFIGYVGVFQGFSPVLNLSVNTLMNQPNGRLLSAKYVDDGSGKDSTPNDGVYTGFVPAHMIDGTGGSYFGVDVNVTGEGLLPAPVEEAKSRGRRSTSYSSLGKFSRYSKGSIIIVNNWKSVPDTTPPDRITDLRIYNTSNSEDVVTLAWTAPGEDFNVGRASGYRFGVAGNEETQGITLLPLDSILAHVSSLLVEAGMHLEVQINTSSIPLAPLGLNISADILTFYFRVKAYDSSNNSAEWSNPVAVSYYEPTTTTTTTSTPEPTTTTSTPEPTTTTSTPEPTTTTSTPEPTTTTSTPEPTTTTSTPEPTTTTSTPELTTTTSTPEPTTKANPTKGCQSSGTMGRQSDTEKVVDVATPSDGIIILGVAMFVIGSVALAVAVAIIVTHRSSANKTPADRASASRTSANRRSGQRGFSRNGAQMIPARNQLVHDQLV
ncbi:calcium-activated chloride channel regulator 1-like [Watersipora subatra]|uniref:calcium-activated chloride channel regulator 1-like n=1 Tax=Watersipora subatra TaxID=2589382 RepID=UPI00355B1555